MNIYQPIAQPLHSKRRWPEGAVVYQIYPRSFQDSNGDGIGDLQGIRSRLDYLQDLGVNAVWLSPFYPSPMADFGYDVADYCNVEPQFGNLADFEQLLADIHSRNMHLMIDLVPNHTSDQHAWFKASRKSADSPYSNWYVWHDAHPDSPKDKPLPPNNWRNAITGESAWQWDSQRRQFYLHSFHVHQPDLNWSNQEVREALKDVMRFWLDKGVDGFRVDAVYWMAKDPLLRDDALDPLYMPGRDAPYRALLHDNSQGWPGVYAYLSELAAVLKEPTYAVSDRFMVTEAYPEQRSSLEGYMAFYNGVDPLVAAPFNFAGLQLPWQAADWRQFLEAFHRQLSAYSPYCVASYAFGNHDRPRLASRLGEAAARSAALMQLTLPGMIYIYYGEELGMQQVPIAANEAQDPAAKGDPRGIGRDPERTPMQWSAEPQAGFSTVAHTWLPLAADYQSRNVASQSHQPNSFLALYKQLCQIRNNSLALRYGNIRLIDVGHNDVVAYIRSDSTEQYLVMVNFSDSLVTCRLTIPVGQLLVSSEAQTKLTHILEGKVELLPHEAALFLQ
jgi:alpha-glucosidase